MNDAFSREIDDVTLDRLVDGELSEAEYRKLLLALDAKPEGWRRCAIAFLEAQGWGRDFRNLCRSGGDEPVAIPSRSRSWPWKSTGLVALASAASFLVAFFVASAVYRSGSDQRSAIPLANVGGTPQNVEDSAREPFVRGSASEHENGLQPPSAFELVVDDGMGRPRQVEIPVFAPDDPRARLLFNERATMPVELIRGLQRLGYQVERQRQWAPIEQDSSNTVLVPIEELRITPVSTRSYQ